MAWIVNFMLVVGCWRVRVLMSQEERSGAVNDVGFEFWSRDAQCVRGVEQGEGIVTLLLLTPVTSY